MIPPVSQPQSTGVGSGKSVAARQVSGGGMFPVLVDIATVAKLLAVDVRFVRRLVFERRIPYLKLGTHLRFDIAEVARWVDEQRVGRAMAAVRSDQRKAAGGDRAT